MSLLALFACSRGGSFQIGEAEVEVDDEGRVLVLVDGERTVEVAGLASLDFEEEVEASLGMWQFERRDESTTAWSDFRGVDEEEGALVLTYRNAAGDEAILRIEDQGESTLFTFEPPAASALKLSLSCDDEGSFHGFGEQYDGVEHRGEAFTLFVSEQGIGRDGSAWQFTGDEHTTYFPMPWYLDARGFGVLLETDRRVEASICEGDFADFEVVGADSLEFRVLHGSTPMEVLRQLGDQVGRPQPPPDWAYGTWMCMQGGQERVREQVQVLEAAGIEASVLWVQDWTGRRANPGGGYGVQYRWTPDTEELYPDIGQLFAELRSDGYHVVGYVNPFVDPALNHWAEMEQGGMLPLDEAGEVYTFFGPRGEMTTADLSNPDTRAYIIGHLQAAVDLGLDGWMADFAEWLPVDAEVFEGEAAEVHNTYPELWQSLSREVLGSEGLYFARSGWTGVQGQAMVHWVGDQEADFEATDGLPTVVPAMLSLGLSGQPFVTHDIAGFSGGPSSEELYLRWTELGAFTPFMRTHDGNAREDNHRWDSDPATTEHFARFSRVHDALAPELRALAAEAALSGAPIVRALFLEYPEERATWELSDQYLLGPDLLVAPMLHEGQSERSVYLPGDTWFNVWTGQALEGPGSFVVEGPIGSPPVFARGADRSDLRSL